MRNANFHPLFKVSANVVKILIQRLKDTERKTSLTRPKSCPENRNPLDRGGTQGVEDERFSG